MQKKTGKPGTFKTLAACAALMVALPFGLRLLVERYAPRSAESDLSATEKLQEIFGDAQTPPAQAEDLLRKPVADWTEREVAAEPSLHRWLSQHAHDVLPWEWSKAARTKDPDGYRKAWQSLCRELAAAQTAEIGKATTTQKAARSELRAREDFAVGLTNRIATMEAALATNGLPLRVACERLERGWLWGFNRKREWKTLADADELRGMVTQSKDELAEQRQAVAQLTDAIATAERRQRTLEESLSELARMKAEGEPALGAVVRAVRLCPPAR